MDHSIDYTALAMAPSDPYFLNALVFVIEKATDTSLAIIALAAGEGPDNFFVSSNWGRTRINYTYDSGTELMTIGAGSTVIDITVKRSQLAQAFTVFVAYQLGPNH